MRRIIPISGKDSCATALVQMARSPDLPYELMFNDVGCELPETYAWLDKVERQLDRKIYRIGRSLEKVIAEEGFLPSASVRFCTRKTKIKPMEEFVGDEDATIYFGIRADEDRVGFVPTKSNIKAEYPLRDLGMNVAMVYAVLKKVDLLPPKFFWQRLYDVVVETVNNHKRGGFLLVRPIETHLAELPEWIFDSLFSWRTRSNCFFCFFQRLSEWVGLLEHHPDLFDRAETMEQQYGNDKQEKPFTWNPDRSLVWIRKHREQIFARRVAVVVKILETKKLTTDPEDLLSVTSCGLFCGK